MLALGQLSNVFECPDTVDHMGSLTLLLGKTRARRKRAMARLGFARVDANGRPDFLVLTATQRKAERVRHEFFSHASSGPAFTPEVRVFSEYLESLARRHVAEKAILTEPARAHLAWSQLQGGFPLLPSGMPAGEALATIHASWGESGLALRDLSVAPVLHQALSGLDSAIGRLATHMPLEKALEHLGSALAEPPVSLQRELGAYSSVVIDDILQLTALRSSLLVELCRAWQRSNVDVVVCFESPRGLGGSEAGAFFNYDPTLASAYPLRALDASRNLRCFLFEALIGRGDARICIATDGGHHYVEPGEAEQPGEAPDLSDLIYGAQPLSVATEQEARDLFADRVRVLHCQDLHGEFGAIATRIRAALDDGVAPSDCCVAVADLEQHLSLLTQVFADYGLPVDIATGPTLASLPIPRLLRACIGTPQGESRPLVLLAALDSDLVSLPGGLRLWRLHRMCRATGLRGGTPSDWVAHWHATQVELPPGIEEDARLFQVLIDDLGEHISSAGDPVSFAAAVLETLEILGLPDSCTGDSVSPAVSRAGHRVWARTLEMIESWSRDLVSTGLSDWSPALLSESLERRLVRTRCSTDTRRPGAVGIVGILELRGLTPNTLFLANLVRSAFPSHRRKNFLLTDTASRQLEVIEPMAEARYLLMSALRNALGDGDIQQLTLSWSATTGDRDNIPAPALQDILSTRTAGPVEQHLGALIVERPSERAAPGPSQSAGLAHHARASDSNLGPDVGKQMLQRQQQLASSRALDAFGTHDGCLLSPPPLPIAIGPTGVESYLRCPARYWYARVLRLAGDPVWEPQLSPATRGSAIHRILERYEKERAEEPGPAARLHAIANDVFEEIRAGYAGDAALLEIERDRLTAGLTDERPGGPLRAWLDLELGDDAWRTPFASELGFEGILLGPVTLRGSIDRVDRLDEFGGHLVIDFKTGAAPSASLVQRGLAFQPIAYLEAASRIWPEEPGIAAYMSIGRSGEVSFNTWVGSPELIESLVPRRRRRTAVSLHAGQRKECLAHAAEAMERLGRGVFHTTLADPGEAGCASCDFLRICRVDTARSQRILEQGGDLQRPVEEVPA